MEIGHQTTIHVSDKQLSVYQQVRLLTFAGTPAKQQANLLKETYNMTYLGHHVPEAGGCFFVFELELPHAFALEGFLHCLITALSNQNLTGLCR